MILPSLGLYVILRIAPTGTKLPLSPLPSLPKHRIKFLKMLIIPKKQTALHIARVINHLSLTILARCSPFATLFGVGNPLPYMPNGAELSKKYPKVAELLGRDFFPDPRIKEASKRRVDRTL